MQKYYCDRCTKEITCAVEPMTLGRGERLYDLCKDCMCKILEVVEEIKNGKKT